MLLDRINILGYKYNYVKPEYKNNSDLTTGCLLMPFVVAVCGIIPSLAVAYIFEVFVTHTFFQPFLITEILIIIVGIIVSAVMNGQTQSDSDKLYEQEMEKYREAVESDSIRVNNELIERDFLYEELAKVEKQISVVRNDLEKGYSVNVIFETYRNFCAVSSFYEYIASGVCDTLDGPDGAMRLYRNEVLQGRIIDSLQTVISSLEDIKQNQMVLYNAIERGNSISEKLLEASIKQAHQNEVIIQNTAIEAHNSEIMKRDVDMLTWISAFNSK